MEGVEAVVDKDLAGAKLAEQIDADIYMILTDVEMVAINYGRPDERRPRCISAADERSLLNSGESPPGSMGPKVSACLEFAERGGRAIITSIEAASRALAGLAGTEFVVPA